jgi:hypothetical protein
MTFGSLPGSGGGSLRRKELSHDGTMLRTGGTRDQLVRLANGIRVVDGDRHRQHDLFFYRRHASSNSLGDQLGRSRFGRAFCPTSGQVKFAPSSPAGVTSDRNARTASVRLGVANRMPETAINA